MESKKFAKLTHLKSDNPTFIEVKKITCVRETEEGKTLVLTGESGQYVKEPVEYVLDIIGAHVI